MRPAPAAILTIARRKSIIWFMKSIWVGNSPRAALAIGIWMAAAPSGTTVWAACGDCAPAQAALRGIAVVPSTPSPAALSRAGLVPANPPRPLAEDKLTAVPTALLPPPLILRSDYAVPEAAAAAAPADPAVAPRGWEEEEARYAWQSAPWAGALRFAFVSAPPGGDGTALRLWLEEKEGDGRRPPAEKWAVALFRPDGAASWTALVFDAFNGTTRPLHLALGVFAVDNRGRRIYYESEARRLEVGWNRGLRFDGERAVWKTESTRWNFEAAWVGTGRVEETVFLFYDAPDAPGVFLDRMIGE